MKLRTVLAGVSLATVMLWAAGAAIAGEDKGKKKKAGEIDPMMAQYMKLAEPGDHHAHLSRIVGTWETKVTMWQGPGAEAQITSGISKNSMALGGRYLNIDYEGDMMGEQFQGRGIHGYDNGKKQHTEIWMDTMGTFMYPATGSCSEGGKVLKMMGQFDDPITGESKKMKSITRIGLNNGDRVVQVENSD